MVSPRRDVVRSAAVGAIALAAPTIFRSAHAQGATVRMLSRSHFIPEYEAWIKRTAERFHAETGIRVVSEHTAQPELPVRYTGMVSSRSGHDVIELTDPFAMLPLFEEHLADVSDVADDLGARHGGWLPIARDYCRRGNVWRGILNYYQDHGSCWRRDLFERVGEGKPENWSDLLRAGRKLKAAGYPLGIQFSRGADATAAHNQILWAFGASWVAPDGRTPAINSPEAREALAFAKQLYDETMTNEVLGWDDAANNRFMLSGRGSWTLNAPSVYWFGLRQAPEVAPNIFHTLPPSGPRARVNYAFVYAYGVWNFSPNITAAKRWLTFFMDNWLDGFRHVAGYNYPALGAFARRPMPVISEIPNLADLQSIPEISRTAGFPGPITAGAAEVTSQFVVPDLFTRVIRGDNMNEAINGAERQIAQIIRRASRG